MDMKTRCKKCELAVQCLADLDDGFLTPGAALVALRILFLPKAKLTPAMIKRGLQLEAQLGHGEVKGSKATWISIRVKGKKK